MVVGEGHVAPGLGPLGYGLGVVLRGKLIHVDACRIGEAEGAVVVLQTAVRCRQPREERGKVPIRGYFGFVAGVDAVKHAQGAPDDGEPLGQKRGDPVPAFRGERLADSARHRPGGMDALSGHGAYDLLADLTETDAAAGHLRVVRHQAPEVAAGGLLVHTHEKIGGGEVEEAQGMALDERGQIGDPAQVDCGRGNLHAEDGIAGTGSGDGVAHGADAADAGGDAGHLPDAAADAYPLEPAEFGHVKPGIGHGPGIVEPDGDGRVPFDAGDGIYGYGAGHGNTYPNVSMPGARCTGSPRSRHSMAARIRSGPGGQPGM